MQLKNWKIWKKILKIYYNKERFNWIDLKLGWIWWAGDLKKNYWIPKLRATRLLSVVAVMGVFIWFKY